MEHEKQLGREDWLRAARLALLRGGVEAVRVAPLARDLGATKGSFYWHYQDRNELLELLLEEWEGELREIDARLAAAPAGRSLATLVEVLIARARLSEQGLVPSDAAIFAWAAVAPEVARRVNRVERERLQLLTRLLGDEQRGEILYLTWLGFVARGQRVPASRRRFPEIAHNLLQLLALGEPAGDTEPED
jgi:AcrR family transcriptional regulator